jgi:hypothetical protein
MRWIILELVIRERRGTRGVLALKLELSKIARDLPPVG